MKLSVVVTVLGQHELATVAIQQLLKNSFNKSTEIIVIDNGGDYNCPITNEKLLIHRPGRNLGVYPVFDYAMHFEYVRGDIVLFLHSDLMIEEDGYDTRILAAFEEHKLLGLLGFVGSNEIDVHGGRGAGTTSNFQGSSYFSGILNEGMTWQGSRAEAHGTRDTGFTNAAVVDGCAMAVRRTAWERIGYRTDFPPHHFYDRLISTQMLEARYRVGVLGIACDHISGQTVSKETRYGDMAKEWCTQHGIWQMRADEPWDQVLYQVAERVWLREYRDQKHLVPIRV